MEKTICLNMIVKNESAIIIRLLNSVLPIINTYCICDTGSTDNTIELIEQYFKDKKINGVIFHETFKNFQYNRNIALHKCKNMADFILLLDADMKLEINDKRRFLKLLNHNSYYTILQGTRDFMYENIRLIPNESLLLNKTMYIGVTHEYLSTPNQFKELKLEKNVLFIKDIGDGGCKQDKFKRDISLFLSEFKLNPGSENNPRYNFYLANSYYNNSDDYNAIKYYKKTIKLNGWYQERWYSCYRLGLIYKERSNSQKAIYYWLEASNIIPERLENIYHIIKYYREKENKQKIAFLFYMNFVYGKIPNLKKRTKYLFLENDIYLYKLYYEYQILAYYNNVKNIDKTFILFSNNCIDDKIYYENLYNYKFYAKSLKKIREIDISETIEYNNETYYSSSTSILFINDNFLMNQRFVNYKIKPDGTYVYKPPISTINKYINYQMDEDDVNDSKTFFPKIETEKMYAGIEDIKLFVPFYKYNDFDYKDIMYTGTVLLSNGKIGVCSGNYDISLNKLYYDELVFDDNVVCEKNWVYTCIENKTLMIYKWYPLTIGNIEGNCFQRIYEKNMPLFFDKVRGSTNGILLYNNVSKMKEIWFICHIVSHESPRQYYHLFVSFDTNMNLLKYSAPFKFHKKDIEYCTGFCFYDNQFVIPYSIWDNKTLIGIYNFNYIYELMLYKP
mgnify:CR=1 FL=1